MMEDFWEMYNAYCSKQSTDPIEGTAWGRSPCADYKIPEGGKANGRFWLEQCDRHVNIQVVGKSLGACDKNMTISDSRSHRCL